MSKKALARIVVPFVIKADAAPEARTFEGLAATWDQDLGQDVIHKGAFKDTLAEWKKSGDAMPLLNSHDHFNIMSALGQMTDGKETKDGLWTKWEVIDGPEGDAVMRRLQPSKTTGRPLVGKMSIGFMPQKFSFEQPEGTDSFFDRVRHIEKADLKEVSLVLFPMNPNAAIDASSVKLFLKQLQMTDVKTVTAFDRMQLRQLASRIGILLKAQPNPTGRKDEDVDDDEDEDLDDEEQPLNPPADEDALEDDSTDDSDDSDSDDSDDSDDSSQAPPPEEGKGVYQMGDALSQRLQRTLLKARTSSLRDGK